MKRCIKSFGVSLFVGILIYCSIEEYYFPAVNMTVIDDKTGEIVKDGLLSVMWLKTEDSIILQPDNGVFHIPKKVYYSFLGVFGGCKMMTYNFCNPYYLPKGSALNLFKLKTSNLNYLYHNTVLNGTEILWDFKKNRWKKPPILEVQLKTKKIMDTMDMTFSYTNFYDILPFEYIVTAYKAGIQFNINEIEGFWLNYIKLRCVNNQKNYEKIRDRAKVLIDERKNYIKGF